MVLPLSWARPRDLALEVGAQHQVVAERARHAVHHDGDGQVLFEPVEVARRDAALDDLQLVLREQREHVGRGVEVLEHELDADLLEIALLHRPQVRGVGDRFHEPDPESWFPGPAPRRRSRQARTRRGGCGGEWSSEAILCRFKLCNPIPVRRARGSATNSPGQPERGLDRKRRLLHARGLRIAQIDEPLRRRHRLRNLAVFAHQARATRPKPSTSSSACRGRDRVGGCSSTW